MAYRRNQAKLIHRPPLHTLRPRELLHGYQVYGVQHMLDHPHSMHWLDMGLGKTIITLSAISDLFDFLMLRSVLIVAPLRVAESVWRQEEMQQSLPTKNLSNRFTDAKIQI